MTWYNKCYITSVVVKQSFPLLFCVHYAVVIITDLQYGNGKVLMLVFIN